MARPRRSTKYLAYVRRHDCCICGYPQPVQAAHVRIGGDGGMGLKPSDFRAVPLCAECHSNQHQYGERTFWDNASRVPGVHPEQVMASLIVGFLDDRSAAIKMLEAMA